MNTIVEKIPELIHFGEKNLLHGCSKKEFVIASLQSILGDDEYARYEPIITEVIDLLVKIGNNPTILKLEKSCCC